jgi:hypothetical protein
MNIKKIIENRDWDICDSERNILFFCLGTIPGQLKETIETAFNDYLSNGQIDKNKYVTAFRIIVEMIQNINNYCKMKSNSCGRKIMGSSYILIEEYKGDFRISTGNLVENSDVGRLKKKLDQVHGLTKDELKKLYCEEIRKPFSKESNGAGLGFIDIARNSSEPLLSSFEKEDENFTFFTLKITVNN